MEIKSETDWARSKIESLLGDDFFLNTQNYSEPEFVWGDLQFDFLETVSGQLDLYILLRICDFLLELNEAECSDDKRRVQFIVMVRKRIDAELNKGYSDGLFSVINKLSLVGIIKNIKRLARHEK